MAIFANARRLTRILRLVLSYLLLHLLGRRLETWPRLARRLPGAELPPPERLRRLFEDLGGTFVKFGQMLALQPDILSPEYCNALFDLLDRVEPFPYGEARRIVAEELGRPPEEIFDSFDPRPLATASVGQVYVAYLRGRKVAVKVQRPQVQVEFAGDLRLMAATMAAIRWLHLKPLYWMLEPMTEFVGWTREEMDYRHEARYSERLRAFAEGSAIQYVPKVYTEYTTRRTLVVEFLEGVTLLEVLRARERGDEVLPRRLKAMGYDGRRFAANVIDNFLGDAFRHGLYHADLHPANLMILPDNVVGYIDFGITGVLSPYSRRHLMVMTLALAQGDMETLSSQFLKLSVFGRGSDVEGFRSGLVELSRDWYDLEGGNKRLRVNFTRVMTDMLQLSRRTEVMPERDIVKYIRSAIAIDGLNLRFEPDFHVGRHLEQECGRFLQWQQVQSALSDDNLLAWSGLGPRLLSEAPARAFGLFDRLVRGELAMRADLGGGDPRAAMRSRAMSLSLMVLSLAVLMELTGEPVAFGLNLFTAEAALIAAGLGLLLPILRRLA
ncbi:MAG TPA: AarF/UbiB family protein [Thermoanaerobaculia bacterium]|jgi:ubiquinone biosynthesis protein|nr:AarF/UbiB family protein [Thermoanaerobaculia bacterium]